jgi:curli biogenesis system outer membrane secretion channel CsgG
MRWRPAITLALTLGLFSQAAVGQDTRPGIAVWTFENGGSYGQDAEDFEALRVGLQQILITELARNGSMRVVERSRLNELIQEQDLGASGRVDPNTAAQVGKLVGAKFIVLGGFVDFFGDFRIDARIVDVETGELVKTDRVTDKREALYQLIVDLSANLTQNVNLPPLSNDSELQQQAREIPTEAVTLYSRAIFFEDRGDTERAIDLYSRALDTFPEYTEAEEALQQLRR